jgi:hypothetical protein
LRKEMKHMILMKDRSKSICHVMKNKIK